MVIETDNLTKTYNNGKGCKNISINVKEGEIFGFLGPNGAGKSTFIKTLTGLVFHTSGSARVLGYPLGDIRAKKRMGYLPENFKYQEWMTGEDLLSFHASLYKIKRPSTRIKEVIEVVGLAGQEKYKVGTYSKGMQQRIGLASAIMADPDLLFLDEPTSALDPVGRKDVRDVIVNLKKLGKTIFLNSHLLSEIEMICDSVTIINKGYVVKSASMDELLQEKVVLFIKASGINENIAKQLSDFDKNFTTTENTITMTLSSYEDIPQIAGIFTQNGAMLYELTPQRESLEKVFIELVKES